MMVKVTPLEQWPGDDRTAFTALFVEGGLLDDRGPLAHWRGVSRNTMQRQYGLWVHWVSRTDPNALHLAPVARATPERLQGWLTSMDHLAPSTLFGHVGAVLRLCRSIEPDRDWTRQQALLAGLQRATIRHGSPRKIGRILSSDVLFEVGVRLVHENEVPITHPNQAVRLRDGAMICLLALIPMRRRALSELALGRSLLAEPDQTTICLDGPMTKNGQPWEAIVPRAARDVLETYLNIGRPVLAARGSGDHLAVWLGKHGAPMNINQFTRAIGIRTKQQLGVDVSPHLFRDSAATTLARASPFSARMIKPVLGHSTTRIAEGHYIQADTISAGRQLASALNQYRHR
tara:strand:+ start:12588 stop:13625 length:1038 start_codon:yes stop_codon:yes gene_type:complete